MSVAHVSSVRAANRGARPLPPAGVDLSLVGSMSSADWLELAGYSLRRAGVPDLAEWIERGIRRRRLALVAQGGAVEVGS